MQAQDFATMQHLNTYVDAMQLADIYKKCKKDDIDVKSYNDLRKQYNETLSKYNLDASAGFIENIFLHNYRLEERVVEEVNMSRLII